MKNRTLLIGAGVIFGVVILLAAAAFILGLGETLFEIPLFPGRRSDFDVYIQSPPLVDVGQEIVMVVSVQNNGEDFLQVEEIRLPQELMDVATITNIFPGSMTQTGFDGETTGFQIGYLIGPGEGREFEITLRPRSTADVIGDVSVVAGKTMVSSGFRLVFENLLALLPTGTSTPTMTPTQTPTTTPSPTATPIGIPYQAVVKIAARYESGGSFRTFRTGSGTLITPDGLILTSAHLVTPGGSTEIDSVMVSLTERFEQPPVEEYLAEIVEIDEDLDVAVLRIISYQDGMPIVPGSLILPSVVIGDSDSLEIGDPISILGYPLIGGETITLTRGDVAGFTDETAYGDRAFIKTTATFSDGASGGLVIDEEGRMVAIPTQIGYGKFTDMVDCRLLADTNLDGRVNQRDTCVPVGGFINALRPINLAWPLIEAAKSGN